MSAVFGLGDRVQLTDAKGRLATVTLAEGGGHHTHRGVLWHAELIGKPEGSVVTASNGEEYLAFRPLLADLVMSMPRGAAIVYPKDAGQILQLADIHPGARVAEAGVGSGALTLWLLRAIGDTGTLVSFERREDFADIARANVESVHGEAPRGWSLELADAADGLAARPDSIDRVVLDMLAPWDVLESTATALVPGGVILCYVATVTQLSRTAEAMRDSGHFAEPVAVETLVRGWHLDGLAVRPDHRMVGHTGFLLTARRLAPGTVAPEKARRGAKAPHSDEDIERWTPGALKQHESSPKRARKAARQAQAIAEARPGE